VRVPSHPLALAVLAAAGPLATTSANRSGDPPAVSCDELHATFGDRVAVYLCQERPLSGSASTVVDLSHPDARLLRAGSVDPERIEHLLGEGAPLLDSPPPG
jgi:tRNA A37 threonylcarbamoyladenosine synthetase subunit TsaC/SUA5/YrdC